MIFFENIKTPAIVLVRPQMGENIGAAARAMANFGLTDLRLVAPRDGWPNPKATDISSGAFEYIDPPHVFDHLSDALADCHYVYATTARRRDLEKPSFNEQDACANAATRAQQNQKTAFVFGAERTGLENSEIAHCHHLLHIDTDDDFSSLNLGQAVLLVAHNISQAFKLNEIIQEQISSPAPISEFENFMNRLENELDTHHFFKTPQMRKTMIENIRAMFLRGEFSEQELNILHGIISAFVKP